MRHRALILAPVLLFASTVSLAHAQQVTTPPPRASVESQTPVVTAEPVVRASDYSLARLVKDLGGDLKNLPSRQNALILGVAGLSAWGISSSDERLTDRAVNSNYMDRLLEFGDGLGASGVQLGGAAATYAAGRLLNNVRAAAVGSDLIRAQIITGGITLGVKVAVDRTRPNGNSFSFPSGHTSTSFATAAVLQRHFGWKVAIPAFGAATYVAISRLQENSHYPSDVIVGAAVGLVAGRSVAIRAGKSRFVLAPVAVYRGAGIQIAVVR
jgi:membrane-associated phospholipid phosphatase